MARKQIGQMYAVRNGRRAPVASVNDAADKWEAFRMACIRKGGGGVSQIGNGLNVVDRHGAFLARVSYNGRIWYSRDEELRPSASVAGQRVPAIA
ncbi:MAG: hypothetical protein ABI478_10850 [Propionivibrio sp.]